jgi:hypothetical protein
MEKDETIFFALFESAGHSIDCFEHFNGKKQLSDFYLWVEAQRQWLQKKHEGPLTLKHIQLIYNT